jgi:hypothetical protein
MDGGKGSFKGRSDYGGKKKGQTHSSTEMGDKQIPPEIKGDGGAGVNMGKAVNSPSRQGDKQIPPMKVNPERKWAGPGD